MLSVRGLEAFYGPSQVLWGVDLDVGPGEIVSVLGRNGAGRSTLAKALVGLVERRGSVRLEERELIGLPTFAIARCGIGYVPEERWVFPGMSVEENLVLGLPARWSRAELKTRLAEIYGRFPALAHRRGVDGAALSGGEQQMLALARALLGRPRMLVMDEPTEGLAPQAVQQVAETLRSLRAQGLAVLLIEQKSTLALALADRVLVMGRGRIVYAGSASELQENVEVQREYLYV